MLSGCEKDVKRGATKFTVKAIDGRWIFYLGYVTIYKARAKIYNERT